MIPQPEKPVGKPQRAVLPSGTVTFLFTEIEGSARRWEDDEAAMAEVARRHDALMRSTVESCAGQVFKTIADAYCAVFWRAGDAVAAAVAVQRALATPDSGISPGLRVRMALHSGTADERDDDYFGPVVNNVARLIGIGHGGQTLVSGVTADLLLGELPPGVGLRAFGEHRLKDLSRPLQVYQLTVEGLADDFPPLRSLNVQPNNLPPQITSFIGRDGDVADVASLLKSFRLVTLVGSAGVGKTRCAMEIGANVLPSYEHGVWVAELATISDPSRLTMAIASALGVREVASDPLLHTVLGYLADRELLLILDNCEHVVAQAAEVASAILRACPKVRLLATSREPLRITGEQIYRMPSLSVPSARDVEALSVEKARQFAAVALFADRAKAVDRRFELSESNIGTVAEICRRLDGIAFAIELAAARTRVVSVNILAERLNSRFLMLWGGYRGVPTRHQTMHALIDWSYELLCERERAVLRRLSIFAGDVTLDVATDVCAGDIVAAPDVFDVLATLVDKSLVSVSIGAEESRYRLLQATREYARERLVEAAEERSVAARHAAAYLQLAKRFRKAYTELPDREWCARVEPELENWRAALVWALEARNDVLLGQRLVGVMRYTWWCFAPAEGGRWVRAAFTAVGDATPRDVVAHLHLVDAHLAIILFQPKAALPAASSALEIFETLPNPWDIAEAKIFVGRALMRLGRLHEAEPIMRDVLTYFRATGVRKAIAWTLEACAEARILVDDVAGARPLYAEALVLFKETGEARGIATVAGNIADVAFRTGEENEAALRLIDDAIASNASRSTDFLYGLGVAYLLSLRHFERALVRAREGLRAARDAQVPTFIAYALQNLAAVAALRPGGDCDSRERDGVRAAHILGYVDARLEALDVQRRYHETVVSRDVRAALAQTLGAERSDVCTNAGRTWSEQQSITEALAI